MIRHIKKLIASRSDTERTVLKNSAWLFVAEIGVRIARGGLGIVAARMLGVSGLGVFSYAIAMGGFLTFFEDAGIATFVTRTLAGNHGDKEKVFGTAMVLKLVLGLAAAALFIGIGPAASSVPDSNALFPVVAVLMFCDALRGFLFSVTRAEQRMHVDSKIQISTNAMIVAFGIAFMAISPTPLALAAGYALGSALGTVAMLAAIRDRIPNLIRSFSRPLFKEIFLAAWPFTVLAVSNVLIFNTDTLFLGHYSTPSEVGFYSAASRLVQMFYIIPSLIATSTFPVLVAKASAGLSIRRTVTALSAGLGALSLPLIAVMTAGSGTIVAILFGKEFAPAGLMVSILALSYVPVYVGAAMNNAVLARNMQGRFVAANLFGVVANIGLDFLLIPKYGGVGASIASVVGLTVITVATGILMGRRNVLGS